MSSYDLYAEDIKQEQEIALWLAKEKYGDDLPENLANKIKGNVRKNFSSQFIYGGAVSVPLLRSCDSAELQEIKKGVSTSFDVDDAEQPLHLESSSNIEAEVIDEEIEELLERNAPIFYGLMTGAIGMQDLNTHSRRKAVRLELEFVLGDLHPEKTPEEISSLAEEASLVTFRNHGEKVKKITVRNRVQNLLDLPEVENSEQYLAAQGSLF